QDAGARIVDATHIVPNREIVDVVVQSVRSEVAAPDVLVNRPVQIVAEDTTTRIEHPMGAFVHAVVLVHRRVRGPKRGDLDNLLAETNVRKMKAPSDQSTVAKELFDLIRVSVGRDVEVLGRNPQEQVAHGAAHEKRLVSGIFQSVE